MKYVFLFLLLAGFAVFSIRGGLAQADAFLLKELEFRKSPVVVELFTSQSCSSCPPADRILDAISSHENVIALGFHVDYWDHLDWKDTFSREFATDRQRGYAKARNTVRIFTPQMVVNGDKDFTGSDRNQLKRAVFGARDIDPVLLSFHQGRIHIELPETSRSTRGLQFWLYGYVHGGKVAIGSGENEGRTVTYSRAAVMEQDLGMRYGDVGSFDVSLSDSATLDGVVVLVQDARYGRIVAAGDLAF